MKFLNVREDNSRFRLFRVNNCSKYAINLSGCYFPNLESNFEKVKNVEVAPVGSSEDYIALTRRWVAIFNFLAERNS
jgi:hypothetical protein